MMPAFLKREKDTLYFNGDGELIYCIPEKYFENKNAIIIGEFVEVMGIFDYKVFDKSGKLTVQKNFYHPSVIRCKPNSIEKIAEFKILETSDPVPYRFLHFKKNDELICALTEPQALSNVEKFIQLLIGAGIPESVPYDKLHTYIADNAALNGFSYRVSAQLYGMIVSELARSRTDLSKAFRHTEIKNMNDYKFINITSLPKYLSPYIAITSRNADESIAAAMTTKNHEESPLEKVMMN